MKKRESRKEKERERVRKRKRVREENMREINEGRKRERERENELAWVLLETRLHCRGAKGQRAEIGGQRGEGSWFLNQKSGRPDIQQNIFILTKLSWVILITSYLG